MRTAVYLPELGLRPDQPVVVSVWFAAIGDEVFEGDRLVEVMLCGATFDVSSPATGRLAEKLAYVDDPVRPGQALGMIDSSESRLEAIRSPL